MNDSEARITPLMGQYAAQMKPWVRFMSVLSFVWVGFMVLIGGGVALMGTLAGAATSEDFGRTGFGAVGGVAIGVSYAVMALLYLPPAIYLHKTANAAGRMQTGEPVGALEALLKSQKSFWRYVGALVVVMFVLGFVAAMLIGVFVRASS